MSDLQQGTHTATDDTAPIAAQPPVARSAPITR